jgi:hypothetical protein
MLMAPSSHNIRSCMKQQLAVNRERKTVAKDPDARQNSHPFVGAGNEHIFAKYVSCVSSYTSMRERKMSSLDVNAE